MTEYEHGRTPMLTVLVACKERKLVGGLEHIGLVAVHCNTSPGWAVASNALLDKAAELGGDALFLDDDVTLTPGCLGGVREYYAAADVFGLDLHVLSTGERQAGARHMLDTQGGVHDWVQSGPAYIAHVSTSAIYIKQDVLRAGVRFPIWDGVHWEDVVFCLDAWLRGFKVMAVPGRVDHDIVGGVGATKRHTEAFWAKWRMNAQAMALWCHEHGVAQALADGRIPVGVREL